MSSGKYTVYLVDDSEDDRLFLRKALERSSKLVIMGEASDGQDTIEYLKSGRTGDNSGNRIPDILLLDIKMPRINGFDVLEWLRNNSFEQMKVAMVSGSWLAEDIARSRALGAAAYFKKTAIRTEQDAMIRSIEDLLENTPCP